jgi:hypothetical protein
VVRVEVTSACRVARVARLDPAEAILVGPAVPADRHPPRRFRPDTEEPWAGADQEALYTP